MHQAVVVDLADEAEVIAEVEEVVEEVVVADLADLADEVVVIEVEEEVEEAHLADAVVRILRLCPIPIKCSQNHVYSDPAGGRGGSRGRGAPGGRGGRGGARGGANTVLEPHRHAGVFIAKGKDHMLVTKNLVPGESVYGEKRISIDGGVEGTKTEYRVWNPFRSKLAAGVLGGLDDIFIQPGAKVLYLGAASGTSVSHVADIVGPVSVCPCFMRFHANPNFSM